MAETGGLIPVHFHDNKNILDNLSENKNNQLMYNGKLIDAALSEKAKNLVKRETDGLFVDGEILGEFTCVNGVLKFKGITVSQEFDKRSVTAMIYELWKEYDEAQTISSSNILEKE